MEYAVGYVRVSDERQRDDGLSIENQITKIRAYCDTYGLVLVGVYGDAKSGKDTKRRPGVQTVLGLAARKRVKHVVIYKLERMFRNTEDALKCSKYLDKNDVALHSVTEKIDTKSPMGNFFFTIIAAIAELERGKISERVKDVMGFKKERGGRVSRFAPLGCKFDGDNVVEDPRALSAIYRAKELVGMGMSYAKTSNVLFREGFVNRNGAKFSKESIMKMVRHGN